jgi:HAD superfamily hydrolase (TIGR01549 family)
MLDLQKIKAVFFDVDDTLYDQMATFRKALERSGILIGDVPMEVFYKEMRYQSDVLWSDYQAGTLLLETMRIIRIQQAGAAYRIEISAGQAAQFQSCYEDEQSKLSPYPEAIPLIQKLRSQAITVGLITNGPVDHQRRKIEQLELHKWVPEQLIFISDALGFAKPDPRVFHHVNQVSASEPEACLYIGDSWRNDIAGAASVGWQSIWLNHRDRLPETGHQPAAVIRAFAELPILLSFDK